MQRVTHLFGRALRETGQGINLYHFINIINNINYYYIAIDRLGLVIQGNEIFKDTVSRHRQIMSLYDKTPIIESNIFIAPNASVIGNVNIASKSSIWYGAVLRSEKNSIKIGNSSNVQDRSVIIASSGNVNIGNNVTIGHGALLNSCNISNNVLIGQGSIIEEGVVVESNSIIAAGAVVLSGTNVPSGQLWSGNPAKFVRSTTSQV